MLKTHRKVTIILTVLVLLTMTLAASMIASANRGTDIETVTVKINYYYYDPQCAGNKGARPYPAFVANMPKDSEAMLQRCPAVPGFSAQNVQGEPVINVTVSFESDHETDIFYVPSDVDYSIRLLQQNLAGNDYDLSAVIRSKGATGTIPKEFDSNYTFPEDYDGDELLRGNSLQNAYYGYTLMYHQPDVIAADGSTEFECYYDRNYYRVDFVLGEGGEGTAPIYAPYQYPLMVENPTRAGYIFKGWAVQSDDPDHVYTSADVVTLPDIITRDITYVAVWQRPDPIPYHVVYRNADLPDGRGTTHYSYWGQRKLYIDPSQSSSLRLEDVIQNCKDRYDDLEEVDESTGKNELFDFPYFAFDEEVTKARNKSVISVNGDGSTVITLYYARRVYELKYVYARQTCSESSYVNTQNAALNDSEGYILVNLNSQKSLSVSPCSYKGAQGLKLNEVNENSVRWFFEQVPDKAEYFYVYTFADGQKRYLQLGNKTALLGTQPCEILVDRKSYNNGEWTLSVLSGDASGKSVFLNDKSNSGTMAAGSMYFSTDQENSKTPSSRWILTTSAEKQLLPGSIEITNSTSNGLDPGTSGKVYAQWWGVKVKSLPSVRLPSSQYFSPGVTIEQKTETKVFHNTPYIYYYISLKAPYNADIESAWPAYAFSSPCYRVDDDGEYRFGSWGTESDSIYRYKYSHDDSTLGKGDHSNIQGPYPTMASELTRINKADSDVAQTLYAWWGDMSGTNAGSYASISLHRLNIYLENIDDDNLTLFDPPDGRYIFECAHNTNTKIYPFVYKGFVIYPSDDAGVASRTYKDTEADIYYTTFRYNRKRSTLTFFNYNTTYKSISSIKYEKSLKGYQPADPPCPYGLNPAYYTFQGWYTSNLFEESEKVDWDNFTMPDHNEILYAYWKPNTYRVNYYNDESAYQNHEPFIHYGLHQYNEYISSEEQETAESRLQAPEYRLSDGTVEKAIRVGWYYYDVYGSQHAFDPDTMPVFGNINLFMKWSTTIPAYYRVHYYLKGTTQKLASDTNGFSFVGLTKTFNAKTEKQLDPAYRSNYFPCYKSTSILLKSDASLNEAIIYYMRCDNVPYRVRYIALNDDGTEGEVLHQDKLVLDNEKAVVTEKHIPITDYVPTAYYVTHTLTVPESDRLDQDGISPDNVITFYYRHDDTHLPYHIKYMLEDEKGREEMTIDMPDGRETFSFKEANYIDSIGFLNQKETAVVTEYDGYEFIGWNETVYYGDAEHETVDRSPFRACFEAQKPRTIEFYLRSDQSDTIFSKEVRLHYIKKTYPVKVSYTIASDKPAEIQKWYEKIKAWNPDLLDDPDADVGTESQPLYKTVYRIEEKQKFGNSYTARAEDIANYRLSGNHEQTIVIANDEVFSKNKITFVYTGIDQIMFYYKAIIPDGTGTAEAPADKNLLNINSECVVQGEQASLAVTAKAYGNEAIDLGDGVSVSPYRFIGWYQDRECTKPVDAAIAAISADGRTMRPTITPNHDHTYYARYDYVYGDDLTIRTDGCLTDDINISQCFEYRIKGLDEHLNQWVDMRIIIQGNGEKTIKGLPVGHYEVTQTSWSWRYQSHQDNNKVTVLITENNHPAAEFHQTMVNSKWLDGNGFSDNRFAE